MTYTLTLCIGMFLSICGQIREYEFPDMASCEKAAEIHRKQTVKGGYAICAITQKGKK